MPMLTTVATGLPVTPVHCPDRTRSATERGVQHRAVLGDVDPLTGEHRLDPAGEVHLLGQSDQQGDRLVGDQVLGEVDVQVGDGMGAVSYTHLTLPTILRV